MSGVNESRRELVGIVAGREIGVKLRDKAFLTSTVVFILIIVGAIVVPALLTGGTPELRVAATSEAHGVAEEAASLGAADAPGLPAAAITVVDGQAPVEALADPDIDAALSMEDGAPVITTRDGVDGDLQALVTAAWSSLAIREAAADAGLDASQVQALTSPEPPRVEVLDPEPDLPVPPELLVVIFGFLFYFTVLTFGMAIAQSVVEEKQSRVVEILVAALPVRWLLAGKVLGNTALALGQVALIVGAGLVGAQLIGEGEIVSQVLGVSGWFLVFFLVGFLMLACLWAVAGSLAARIEDLQSTTLYMQIAVMAPFFTAVFLQEEGPARVALSYVPLTAPLLMPARIATGDAAAWEPWVALALVMATAAALVRVGARLYAGSVLNTSKRTRVGAAWGSGRAG